MKRISSEDARPYRAEIRPRGQLTIPKQVREKGALDAGDTVSILPLGDSILVTPRRLELDEARREIRRVMKSSGATLKELLEGLETERASLFEKTYGSKQT
jgi:AbrB family looped-hinge helix DNA binding protein